MEDKAGRMGWAQLVGAARVAHGTGQFCTTVTCRICIGVDAAKQGRGERSMQGCLGQIHTALLQQTLYMKGRGLREHPAFSPTLNE